MVCARAITFSILFCISRTYFRCVMPSGGNPPDLDAAVRLPTVIPVVSTKAICERQEDNPVEMFDFEKQAASRSTRSLNTSTGDPCNQRQSTIPCSTSKPIASAISLVWSRISRDLPVIPLCTSISPEFCVLISRVPEAGNKHPFQDRIDTGEPGIGLLEMLGLDTEFEKRLEHSGKQPRALLVPDRLRERFACTMIEGYIDVKSISSTFSNVPASGLNIIPPRRWPAVRRPP